MQSFNLYPLENHKKELFDNCKRVTVKEFTNLISDGDLIFSRSTGFEGSLIQLSGHCIWNHVSMCVYKHWCESTNNNTIYTQVDVEKNNNSSGVKLWSLYQGLTQFLQQNPGVLILGVSHFNSSSQDCIPKMWKFWKREQGKPYTSDYSVLLFSWLDSVNSISRLCCWDGVEDNTEEERNQLNFLKNTSRPNDYFCSQIIVECLKECGVMISGCVEPTEWTVADLANNRRLQSNLFTDFKYEEIKFYSVCLE